MLCMVTATQSLTAQDSLQQARINNKWAYFSIRPGIALDELRMTGNVQPNNNYQNAARRFISGVMDIDNPEMNNFMIRVEISYMPHRFYSGGDQRNKDEHTIKINTVTPDFSLLYKVHIGSLHIYTGGGVGWYSRKLINDGWLVLSSEGWSYTLTAGLIYKNKIELSAKVMGSNISDVALYDLRNNTGALVLGYRF